MTSHRMESKGIPLYLTIIKNDECDYVGSTASTVGPPTTIYTTHCIVLVSKSGGQYVRSTYHRETSQAMLQRQQ